MDARTTPITPLERYRTGLQRDGFIYDPAQEQLAQALNQLYKTLIAKHNAGLWSTVIARLYGRNTTTRGLYIWGDVGRGKTWLMDSFYRALPFAEKKRLHFHRFMRAVHKELKTLRDQEDPLAVVAARWAKTTHVLCFDEFAVTDIADATLLGRLLTHLFSNGVTLVATSNIRPDDLYKNGLKRELFLPAIAALKKHTRVVHCGDGDDYRLRHLSRTTLYYTPADAKAENQLLQHFNAIAGTVATNVPSLTVEDREIPLRKVGDSVVWFDFRHLCAGPRSANDYIEIARLFSTVIVSAVPAMGAARDAEARRFIALVDELYDHDVKLIVSASGDVDSIYTGKRLAGAFERTRSRLIEMQSKAYLARRHAP